MLVPLGWIERPPPILSSRFTIMRGGRHADGLTRNSLIVLSQGVYLELIAFEENISPADRANHWWGDKQLGWIDWCLSNVDATEPIGLAHHSKRDSHASEINSATTPVVYDDPIQGGRTRLDGTEIRWTVTFPHNAYGRGTVPFWCHDITPRSDRVCGPEKHPSKAVAIKELHFKTHSNNVSHLSKQLGMLIGAEPKASVDDSGKPVHRLSLHGPRPSSSSGHPITIKITGPSNDDDNDQLGAELNSTFLSCVQLWHTDDGSVAPVRFRMSKQWVMFTFESLTDD